MKYKKIDPNAPPQDNGAAELKKVRIKRGLLTAGVFVVLMGLFEALVALEWKPVYPIYLGAMTVLLLLFLFFNKGFGNAIPPREALPEEWSAEETDRFYEKLLRDKKIARRILIFLIPLLLVFLIDSLVLFLPGLLGL
jgi:hypothetical protein